MAFRNAKSFAAARRASIRQMARQNMGSAIQSFAIRTGMAIAMMPFSPVAAASMGVFAASAAYNAVSAANRFTKSGASAAASMPGIARMNAARAVMGHSQVAMRQGQARVAAGRLTLARAAAVRAGIEMRTSRPGSSSDRAGGAPRPSLK